MLAEQVHFPRPSDGKKLVTFEWTPIRYRNVISVLKNPFYAGAYAYGKGEKRTEIVDGRARKSYGHRKPLEEWEVLLKDHHDGYIDWVEFERNQKQLVVNAYGKVGGAKLSSRGRCRRSSRVPTVPGGLGERPGPEGARTCALLIANHRLLPAKPAWMLGSGSTAAAPSTSCAISLLRRPPMSRRTMPRSPRSGPSPSR